MSSQRGRTAPRGAVQWSSTDPTETETDTDQGAATIDEPKPQSVTQLSKSEAFDVLRNSRRRAAIVCLREHDGPMSVNELTTCVAAREYDVEPDELSAEQYKRVYTGLYQCHLDRADELGVLDFDAETNTVRLREQATQLEPFLADEQTPGSARIEFGVALAVAAIVTLGGLGVGPFAAVSASALAGVTIAALLGLALFQLY